MQIATWAETSLASAQVAICILHFRNGEHVMSHWTIGKEDYYYSPDEDETPEEAAEILA